MATTNPKKNKSSQPEVHAQGSFESEVVACIIDCRDESALVKWPRLQQNRRNWDAYFLRGDFSNKIKGQSREYLPKSANAAEQVTSLVNATLTNFDKWYDVRIDGKDEHPIFTTHVVRGLMQLYLQEAKIKVVLSDGVKVGIHEGEVTIERIGEFVEERRFRAKGAKLREITKRRWALNLEVVSAEDWFPDPYKNGSRALYNIRQSSSDWFTVASNVESEDNPDGIYDRELVDQLQSYEDLEVEQRKSRNRGESNYNRRIGRRKPIHLIRFVGTLLGRDGKILVDPETGEEMVNVVATVANERVLIQRPIPNPRWDGSSGFNHAPILRTPFATFYKALMDAPERLNVSINELFNLMLDGGLSAVHGVKQIHASWLEDPGQVSKGIAPGTTLVLREDFPLGQSVMERVDTGNVPGDVLSFFNILVGLHTEASLTNEIRLGGLPSKQVRATEVVAANQALSGIFDSITKEFEVALVEPLLLGIWHDILQNIDEFPEDDLRRIAGDERAAIIKQMTRQQRFAVGFGGFKFVAKGLSTLTERLKDFQRLAQFLSVVGANEALFKEFTKEYSMPRLLAKFMHSLTIDPEEIKLSPEEIKARQQLEAAVSAFVQRAQIESQNGGGKGAASGESPNGRSAPLPQEPEDSGESDSFVPGNGAGLVS